MLSKNIEAVLAEAGEATDAERVQALLHDLDAFKQTAERFDRELNQMALRVSRTKETLKPGSKLAKAFEAYVHNPWWRHDGYYLALSELLKRAGTSGFRGRYELERLKLLKTQESMLDGNLVELPMHDVTGSTPGDPMEETLWGAMSVPIGGGSY